MTAHDRDQADTDAGEDDEGWVSLSESPSGPLTPPSAAAEGRTAPPPPDAEDDGWVSVPSGTPRPSGPAPPRPARVRETEVALRFTGLGGQLLLNRGQTVRLGRSRSWATPEAAEILADESTVSGRHASVEYAEDGTVWLTEVAEGSTNGIRVNRHQVLTPGQALRLRTGDMVWLGPHVTFLVRGGALPVPDTPADGTGQHPDG
ncbi:FHA domain-containing protein [Streptomyces sp. NRRL S-37]|uniref:FHA domain-containing protein n=1 Tax=Streptomyces sp. NRRL S-37 TaxID=1463903 RepID=UPI000A6A7045|nr:FHA domain-containing protein [Streptomyces sp. NRRL S-37]